MTVRGFVAACMLIAFTVGAPASAAAQDGVRAAPACRTAKPDLQGVWDFKHPDTAAAAGGSGERGAVRAEEAAAIEARSAERSAELNAPTERSGELLPVGGNVGGYNHYWVDQGASVVDDQRTSLIVDPPDGRVPALQPGLRADRAVPGRGSAGHAPGSRPGRRHRRRQLRGPRAGRALPARVQLRTAYRAGRLQPEPADLPDARPCRHPA